MKNNIRDFEEMDEENKLNQKKEKHKILHEFAKISNINVVGKCIKDIHYFNLYLDDKRDNPEYELYIYSDINNPDLNDLLKLAIENFLKEDYMFYNARDTLCDHFNFPIKKSLDANDPNSIFWCSKPQKYIDCLRLDKENLYRFALIEFYRKPYEIFLTFNGELHPTIDSLQYIWALEWSRDFNKIKNYDEIFRRASMQSNWFLYHNSVHFNMLSTMQYEKSINKGSVIFLNKKNKGNDIDNLSSGPRILINLKESIMINDYKRIRKLLQITNSNVSLLLNENYEIYGIGDLPEDEGYDYYKVVFTGYFKWKMFINNIEYLSFLNSLPQLPNNTIDSTIEIRNKIRQTFEETESDEDAIIQIIEQAKLQENGTMIVISVNAKDEAERLKESCTMIHPDILKKEVLELVTCIDGAVICDTYGTCYAIGAILDGIVSSNADPARGARYNSAIRYVEQQKLHFRKTFVAVISEDKYVNYISTND